MEVGSLTYRYTGKIIRWIDGDTAVVEIDLGFRLTKQEAVRLRGVNTPELSSKDPAEKQRAYAALEFCREQAPAQMQVWIESHRNEKEKYGRWLADIWTSGETKSMSTRLIEAGLGAKN